MDVYVGKQRVRLSPAQAIGKGGEADVYALPTGQALKIFKTPDHVDFRGWPEAQEAARERIALHQRKLPELMARGGTLPDRVVAPQELATDRKGREIAGYTMKCLAGAEPILRYGERSYRSAGVPHERVRDIFLDLHRTVNQAHHSGVVIGDFNDLNVLVQGNEAYLIDVDSFQFDSFPCQVFTAKFVDPMVCDSNATMPVLCRPLNAESDWYAFTIMLMQSLLFVGPYGGIYRPAKRNQAIPHDARPLHRITVFHPEVQYPKPAVPLDRLPDELLHYLNQVFAEDRRGEFPRPLLEGLRWTRCTSCGTEYARQRCPNCAQAMPAAVIEAVQVRGKVVARRVFRTEGIIVAASVRSGQLQWLYHDGGTFKREDGSAVLNGDLDPHLRFWLGNDATMVGHENRVITLNKESETLAVDRHGTIPVLEVNERHRYWVHQGRLQRDGTLGPEVIGEVLEGQTRFWIGPTFGFGFYRAGNLSVAFVFDAEKKGLNDRVQLPPLRGQLVDAECFLSEKLGWFLVAMQDQGQAIHHAIVIRPDGKVAATTETVPDKQPWLASVHGKCAAGEYLFAPTDGGVVRVGLSQGRIEKTVEYPDTEPFVDSGCRLLAGREGMYVVGPQEISLLRIS